MSEIFISYARPNETQAVRVEQALVDAGYAVWRDAALPAHRPYAEVIQERLNCAEAVVVLWSAEGIKSQWVRAEADTARELGTLVQASIDASIPPIPFNQIQCANLSGWNGDAEAPGWRKLVASVSALVGPGNEVVENVNRQPQQRRRAICVLPFANMSGDPEQEYFSDGISEDITTDLSKISALSVTARNTAFTFKKSAVDIAEIVRKLGVSHVLEGSVRKAGGRVRITAQLIDGATGDHVWAERYDRDLTDIFAIQDELSAAIVDALKLKLLPEEKHALKEHGTINAEAYNLYLMARQYWVSGNYGDSRRDQTIIRICQKAVEFDPSYARAWALMALAQTNLKVRDKSASENGIAAAERALALDPHLAEAHCVVAVCASEEGDTDRATAEIELAIELDPNSWEVNKEAGRLALKAGRAADAVPYFAKASTMLESDYHAPGLLTICLISTGDTKGAREAARLCLDRAERALAQDPNNGTALGHGAYCLAYLGEFDRAKDWIARALLIDPDNLTLRYNLACSLVVNFKDFDGALDMLGPYFEKVASSMVEYATHDPDMVLLRGNPRFEKMIANARARVTSE